MDPAELKVDNCVFEVTQLVLESCVPVRSPHRNVL